VRPASGARQDKTPRRIITLLSAISVAAHFASPACCTFKSGLFQFPNETVPRRFACKANLLLTGSNALQWWDAIH
jgi:hypothetical protein